MTSGPAHHEDFSFHRSSGATEDSELHEDECDVAGPDAQASQWEESMRLLLWAKLTGGTVARDSRESGNRAVREAA